MYPTPEHETEKVLYAADELTRLLGGVEHLFRFVLRCREHLDIAPFGK